MIRFVILNKGTRMTRIVTDLRGFLLPTGAGAALCKPFYLVQFLFILRRTRVIRVPLYKVQAGVI